VAGSWTGSEGDADCRHPAPSRLSSCRYSHSSRASWHKNTFLPPPVLYLRDSRGTPSGIWRANSPGWLCLGTARFLDAGRHAPSLAPRIPHMSATTYKTYRCGNGLAGMLAIPAGRQLTPLMRHMDVQRSSMPLPSAARRCHGSEIPGKIHTPPPPIPPPLTKLFCRGRDAAALRRLVGVPPCTGAVQATDFAIICALK